MIKNKKLFSAANYTFLSMALALGLMALFAEQNSYKSEPSFLYYGVITNLLPVVAVFTLIVYYKQASAKIKHYYWLNAGIAYCLGIIIWQIVQNKTSQYPLAPIDLLSPVNINGYSLGIYNLLILLPLVITLVLAVVSYLLKPTKSKFGLNSPWLSTIVAAGVILITFSLRYAELKIVSGELRLGSLSRRSVIEGNFKELSKSDDGAIEFVDLDYYNTDYSYQQLAYGFVVDSSTKVYDLKGSSITLTDLKPNDKIKVIYNALDGEDAPIPAIYLER